MCAGLLLQWCRKRQRDSAVQQHLLFNWSPIMNQSGKDEGKKYKGKLYIYRVIILRSRQGTFSRISGVVRFGWPTKWRVHGRGKWAEWTETEKTTQSRRDAGCKGRRITTLNHFVEDLGRDFSGSIRWIISSDVGGFVAGEGVDETLVNGGAWPIHHHLMQLLSPEMKKLSRSVYYYHHHHCCNGKRRR